MAYPIVQSSQIGGAGLLPSLDELDDLDEGRMVKSAGFPADTARKNVFFHRTSCDEAMSRLGQKEVLQHLGPVVGRKQKVGSGLPIHDFL